MAHLLNCVRESTVCVQKQRRMPFVNQRNNYKRTCVFHSNSLRYSNYWVNKRILNRKKRRRKKKIASHYDYTRVHAFPFFPFRCIVKGMRIIRSGKLKSIYSPQLIYITNCIYLTQANAYTHTHRAMKLRNQSTSHSRINKGISPFQVINHNQNES